MWTLVGVAILGLSFITSASAAPPADEPAWAFGFRVAEGAPGADTLQATQPAPDDGTLQHVPGSSAAFTVTQIRDAADWFPGDHPQMPDVVAHGRKPDIRPFALCHYPNGKGRSENAGVSGLPYAYFVRTLADFRNGARKSTDSRKANTTWMIGFAKAMTDEEIKACAEYFGAIEWTPWIRVVEAEMVPKTRIVNGLFLALPGDGKEPIGDRIIEVPENAEVTEVLRDPHAGFVAYVPVGSVRKGEALVMKGGDGKTTACGVCHGPDLLGLGPVPGIAGRSPSYVVRQLFDMQQGSRSGIWTDLMKPVVAKLTSDDMLAIAAYTASRPVHATNKRELATAGK